MNNFKVIKIERHAYAPELNKIYYLCKDKYGIQSILLSNVQTIQQAEAFLEGELNGY